MIKGYYSRIAAFLSGYLQMGDGSDVPPQIDAIRNGIAMMISDGTFTRETMKLEALRTHDVIIREDLFPKESNDED